jgi:hypothetical protein
MNKIMAIALKSEEIPPSQGLFSRAAGMLIFGNKFEIQHSFPAVFSSLF